MRSSRLLVAAALGLATTVAGCRWWESRTNCPTDARGLMLSCAGEEAVRRCPCGPDEAYYGHQRTVWTAWPNGWEQQSCEACAGESVVESTTGPAPHYATPTPHDAAPSHEYMPTLAPEVGAQPTEEVLPEPAPGPPAFAEPIEPVDTTEEVEVVPGDPIPPAEPSRPAEDAVEAIDSAPVFSAPYAVSSGLPPMPAIPDPPYEGPSEPILFDAPPEGDVPSEPSTDDSATAKKRFPSYTDLFKP